MTNSKAYLSFILLFAFLFSSHVLADKLWVASPENQHSYRYIPDGAGVDIPVKPLPMPMPLPPSPPPPRPSTDIEKISTQLGIVEGEESTSYNNFPRASRKSMLGTRIKHYPSWVTYDPSNLKFTEPENYEDASLLRSRNMVRPSEDDRKAFRHAFPANTYRTKIDGKTRYGGVLKVQDVGDETDN